MVIGEFSAAKAGGDWTIGGLYEAAAALGYAGAWDWALVGGGEDGNDDADAAYEGMRAVRDAAGVRVEIGGGGGGGACDCEDVAPDGSYTCEQQAGFGQCGQDWMKGWCCRSCFQCEC